ncbi:MAG: prepilin peptidase [Lachnospiraceae bacterium]|nr:prepilin peptidase [Lachnospiraceae bacterium]MBR4816413.1 prepilin peptidase [Lachnospiraceae bacterium]
MYLVCKILFGVYLAYLSVEDIRKKSLPVPGIAAGLLFVPFFVITEGASNITLLDNLKGMIPGELLIFISFLSRGQIGIGDGAVVLITGVAIGIGNIVIVLTGALLLISVFSMLMLLLGKLNRKSTLPFVPFVFAGYLGVLIM